MIFPLKLRKRVRVAKGPIHLGVPVVSDDAIFVGLDRICRFESDTLELAWTNTYESFGTFMKLGSVLLIGNGFDELRALNAFTGEFVWSRSFRGAEVWQNQLLVFESKSISILEIEGGNEIDRMELPCALSVADRCGDVLLLQEANDDGVVAAYDLGRRSLLWKRNLLKETIDDYDAPGEAITLTAGREAFVLTKGDVGIFGCSLEDGQILWHQKAFVPQDVPVATQGNAYVMTRGLVPTLNDFATFMCFDEKTGEKKYETEHQEFLAYRPSRPTIHRDHVFFGSEGGFVFAFRLSDGELVWCHRTKVETWQPAALGDRVYVTSDDGHLLAFEGRTRRASKTKER